MKMKVVKTEVADIRVPTSDTLLGSDPFHKKPNYSCVYTSIQLSDGLSVIQYVLLLVQEMTGLFME